jgi:hypothetical protein
MARRAPPLVICQNAVSGRVIIRPAIRWYGVYKRQMFLSELIDPPNQGESDKATNRQLGVIRFAAWQHPQWPSHCRISVCCVVGLVVCDGMLPRMQDSPLC